MANLRQREDEASSSSQHPMVNQEARNSTNQLLPSPKFHTEGPALYFVQDHSGIYV